MIDNNQLSKDCSYILRHATDKYHLKRDISGWVPLNDFIAVLNLRFEWCNLSENDIESMIIQSNKKDMK